MKIIRYIVLLMAFLTVLIVLTGISLRKAGQYKVEKYTNEIAEKIISEMNDDQLVGQLFMFLFQLDDLENIKKINPGGIFIYGGNIPRNANDVQDIAKLDSDIEKINSLYLKNNIPLPWYSIDQEGGRVRRIQTADTDFPSAMTFGEAYTKTGKTDLPLLAAFHTCIQLRKHGIQWPLTPVADVQINPDNPVIGERSYGSDPDVVFQMVREYTKGLQNGRCMSSIKHFPGHGDTNLDSHKDLPEIHKSQVDLNKIELYPYYKIFKNNEQPHGLMSAHIVFKEISDQPATLSKTWLTDKLRNEMNFKGIIITDDLAMNAMNIYKKKGGIENLAVESFNAGADILLYVYNTKESHKMLDEFKDAYARGIVSKDRVRDSVHKIITRKIKLGILDTLIKKNMESWPAEFQQKAHTLLKYSNEVSENVRLIETQLASPESVNDFVSKNGIKTIWGNPDQSQDIFSYPLFTDLAKDSERFKSINEKVKNIYPLSSLGKVEIPAKCVILQTQKNSIRNITGLQRKKPCIIYSINDPFPKNKIVPFLNKNDVLITTFSPTEMSANKLVETYLEGIIPPKTSIVY
jgi:beta-N-acetylhexosaminidase